MLTLSLLVRQQRSREIPRIRQWRCGRTNNWTKNKPITSRWSHIVCPYKYWVSDEDEYLQPKRGSLEAQQRQEKPDCWGAHPQQITGQRVLWEEVDDGSSVQAGATSSDCFCSSQAKNLAGGFGKSVEWGNRLVRAIVALLRQYQTAIRAKRRGQRTFETIARVASLASLASIVSLTSFAKILSVSFQQSTPDSQSTWTQMLSDNQ